MIHVHFTIDPALRDLLPRNKRHGECDTVITIRSALLDAVQAQGIPHVEVASLTRNGEPATWNTLLEEGDRIEVLGWQPGEARCDELGIAPSNPPAFLLDVHLGRLASYLRLLGFDTAYPREDPGDPALVSQAVEEHRFLLTCDRHLLMHRALRWGRCVRSRSPVEQAAEVLDALGLHDSAKPFTRCMECNGLLVPPSAEQVRRESPPLVRLRLGLDPAHYKCCAECHRLYWPGTHWERMKKLLYRWGVGG